MKTNLKRLLSLLLTFTLCFGLAAPAFADGEPSEPEAEITVPVEEPEIVIEAEPEEAEEPKEVPEEIVEDIPEEEEETLTESEAMPEEEPETEEPEEEAMAEVLAVEPTNLVPVIRITTVNGNGNKLKKSDGYAAIASIVITDENGEINVSRETQDDQIKVRGNSTADAEKKPFNIKLSKKVDVLGMGKGKKWCLLANCFDPTLLRNYVALELARRMGLAFTPDQRIVELYLDGVYKGCYLLTEAVQINENRVDINSGNGDFIIEYEKNRVEAETTYITSNGLRFSAKDPEYSDFLEDAAAEQHVRETVAKLGAALDSGNYEAVCEIVDVESMADFYLLNEFYKTVDVGLSSVYFYYTNGKFYGGPVWDFDLSSGNAGLLEPSHREYFTAGSDKSYIGLYAVKQVFGKLMNYPEFRILVSEELDYFKDTFQSLVGENGLIQTTMKAMRPVFEKNFTSTANGGAGWSVSKQQVIYMYTPGKTYDANFNYYYNWIVNRLSWMNNSWGAAICAATEHTWEVDTLEATCANPGYRDAECLLCGQTSHVDYPATGKHSFGAWEEFAPGMEHRVCSGCGKEEQREIAVCEAVKQVSLTNGTLELYLKGSSAGTFTFAKTASGWTIQEANGQYLAVENGKLVRKAEAFSWTYSSNAFSCVQKKAPANALEKIFGTKSVTYYLASASDVSTTKVTAELYQEIALSEHAFGKPQSKRGGTHTIICTNCGVTEEYRCDYDEGTHTCICGAVDPSAISVSASAKVTKSTQKYLVFFTRTTYKATISTSAVGTTVKTVEYSTDSGKTWTKGTSFASSKEITAFQIRVTDAGGTIYRFAYSNGAVKEL